MQPPLPLGRSVVVAGGPPPPAWASFPRVAVGGADLADPASAERLVERLHRAWVTREPVVIDLTVDPSELRVPERVTVPPWEVGAGHLFPRERLQFLVWTNSVDARSGTPVWWWAHKAEAVGATLGGPADILLPDGTPAWVDGGPRGPLTDVGHPVVHAESLRRGSLRPSPPGEPDRDPTEFDPGQAAAVGHGSGPARIIAPAGSGKTRTLVGRIRHLVDVRGVDPASILAVAYNRRAREELVERLPASAARVDVRTVHALGWSILRQVAPGLRLLNEREVRATLDRLVDRRHQANTDRLGPYLEAMTAVRVGFSDPDRVETTRDDVPGFAVVLRRYRDRLRAMDAVDHEEQVLSAIEVLLSDPSVRAERQSRHRHVLIDEFQDLTPAYLLLLRLVAAPELAVFGVGDDDQTIYGYSGADPAFLINFDTWFPGAGSHPLDTNYRSVGPIVRTAGTLLTHNRTRVEKEIRPAPGAAEPDDAVLVERVAGPAAADVGVDHLTRWLEDGEGVTVLGRVHAALLPLHLAALERGVPTALDLEGGFLERTGVASALAWLRIARHPHTIDPDDLAHAARRPPSGLVGLLGETLGPRPTSLDELRTVGRGLTDNRQAAMWWKFVDRIERLSRSARRATTADLLTQLVDDEGLAASALKLDTSRPAGSGGHGDDLMALIRAAALHPDPDTFADWLAERLAIPAADGAVRLTTVHRVKGLEWDRVLVVGVDEGTLPHRLAADVEEERRILHVAITRARRQVVLIADESHPSRFLPELDSVWAPPPDLPTAPPKKARTKRPGVVVTEGDHLAAPGGYKGTVVAIGDDHVVLDLGGTSRMRVLVGEHVRRGSTSGPLALPGDLRERLRAFRTEESSRREVPPFVVFSDRTLDALVERRPTSRSELLAIPGIGPAKLESYGAGILAVLGE